jgi:hypothetical protein
MDLQIMKNYYKISAILFLLFSALTFSHFDEIKFSELSKLLGPALIFFYLTYLADAFLYFYYKKNSHLRKAPRDIAILAVRAIILVVIGYFVISPSP